jgi:uncharacterized protein (TIGR03067 family)
VIAGGLVAAAAQTQTSSEKPRAAKDPPLKQSECLGRKAVAGRPFVYHLWVEGRPNAKFYREGGPDGMTVSEDGTLRWTPPLEYAGRALPAIVTVRTNRDQSINFEIPVVKGSAPRAAATGTQDAVKKDMALLEGEWSMVSGEVNGFSMPKETVESGKRVAKAGETTVSFGGQVRFKARFRIAPARKPKAIDYAMTEGPTKGKTYLGIYRVDGDTVTFCFAAPGKERPTDFTAGAGSERTLSVWRRNKK